MGADWIVGLADGPMFIFKGVGIFPLFNLLILVVSTTCPFHWQCVLDSLTTTVSLSFTAILLPSSMLALPLLECLAAMRFFCCCSIFWESLIVDFISSFNAGNPGLTIVTQGLNFYHHLIPMDSSGFIIFPRLNLGATLFDFGTYSYICISSATITTDIPTSTMVIKSKIRGSFMTRRDRYVLEVYVSPLISCIYRFLSNLFQKLFQASIYCARD